MVLIPDRCYKQPGEREYLQIDFSPRLGNNETIATIEQCKCYDSDNNDVTSDIIEDPVCDETSVKFWFKNGTSGSRYNLTVRVVTDKGTVLEEDLLLIVEEIIYNDQDSGGVSENSKKTFLQLADTPSSYSGYASKFVCVKAGEDGLTFSDVPPSGGWILKRVSSNYTAFTNEFVLVDSSLGIVTITLPSPVANARVAVKKVDSSVNNVVVNAGTANIDGNSTFVLETQYESYEFYCDGTNWYIL